METKTQTTVQKSQPTVAKTVQAKPVTKTTSSANKVTSVPKVIVQPKSTVQTNVVKKPAVATKTVESQKVASKATTATKPATIATQKTTTAPAKTNVKPQVQSQKIVTTQKAETKVTSEEQKAKNAVELIGIFKKLEKNLVDVLQTIPNDVNEEGSLSFLDNIKTFKKKVDLARKIFDEYENTSNLITQMIESEKNDDQSIEISKKVIEPTDKAEKSKINEKELLRQVQSMEKQSKGLDKIEIEAVGDTVVVKKKSAVGNETELRNR